MPARALCLTPTRALCRTPDPGAPRGVGPAPYSAVHGCRVVTEQGLGLHAVSAALPLPRDRQAARAAEPGRGTGDAGALGPGAPVRPACGGPPPRGGRRPGRAAVERPGRVRARA